MEEVNKKKKKKEQRIHAEELFNTDTSASDCVVTKHVAPYSSRCERPQRKQTNKKKKKPLFSVINEVRFCFITMTNATCMCEYVYVLSFFFSLVLLFLYKLLWLLISAINPPDC